MQFIYDKNASQKLLTIRDDNYRYLAKVRRVKIGDTINLRNLKDDILYTYKIEAITKKEISLILLDKKVSIISPQKNFHLLWCVIDPKTVYQTLPMLNQIGVKKISFIYCERSQKNFKIDLEKAKRVVINSSQQCGRSDTVEFEVLDSLDEAIDLYRDFAVLDFGGEVEWSEIDRVLVGCEGGFSEKERQILSNHRKVGLKTKLILKSETAVLTFCIKSLI
jgi:16S rRNA (uracil1498-N3)-methyltransferase